MKIKLHAFEKYSSANGPGLRSVVWFQGCSLRCPFCFNPATHDPNGGYESNTTFLVEDILKLGERIKGVTISGGEPFQQSEALHDLLNLLNCHSKLSVLVFTGYTKNEIQKMPLGFNILQHIDVLIAGRYQVNKHLGHGLIGSANQIIHLLTQRYSNEDFTNIPLSEIIIHVDGSVTISGIDPLPLQL